MIQNTHLTRTLLLAFLLSLFSPIIIYSKSCVNPVTVVCPTVDCGVNIVHISQADLPFVIDTPGDYCLIGPATWTPPVTLGRSLADPAAITITSSDVNLNLNGYPLQQSGSAINTVGIKIASTDGSILSNIIVRNGTVQNIASLGIYADTIQNLLLEDLTVSNNGTSGSITSPIDLVDFVGGIAIVGPGGFFPPPSPAPATILSQNIVLKNINALYNGGSSGMQTYGIAVDNAIDVLIENCQANWNTSPNNGTAGFYVINSNQCVVNNCQANDNSGANFAVGFYVTEPGNAAGFMNFNSCIARENNLAGAPIPAAGQTYLFADGFYMQYAFAFTLINCEATYQGSNLTLPQALPVTANGFDLEYTTDSKLTSCIATHNGLNPNFGLPLTVDYGRGFHIDAERITFENCFSQANQGNIVANQYDLEDFSNFGPSSGLPPFLCVLNRCTAKGVATAPNNFIGIRIFNGTSNVIENCLIQDCSPDGILIDQSPGTSCYPDDSSNVGSARNVIKHNQIQGQIATGYSPGVWAIEDNSGTGPIGDNVPNNAYYDNYAYNYLGNVPGMENYNTGVRNAGDNDTTTYIVTWNIPGAPPASALPGMSNYSILQNCTGL